MDKDRRESPPTNYVPRYVAFCDPSGGRQDSFALAIGHHTREQLPDRERGVAVVDLVRAWNPPFSPEQVVGEIVALLRSYGVRRVYGDRWGGEFVKESFRIACRRSNALWAEQTDCYINYRVCDPTKSELYLDFLAVVNSRSARLVDNKRMLAEALGLERKPGRNQDAVDHRRGQHDDLINAVAGLCYFVRSATLGRKRITRGRAA